MSTSIESRHIYLNDLHFEHNVWLNELNFFKDEVKIFEGRLETLVTRYTNKEVLARLEQFQNRFIREKEVIDELLHAIRINEQNLAKFAEEHPIAIDHVHFSDHKSLREDVNRFRELFGVLKEDFYKYMSQWF